MKSPRSIPLAILALFALLVMFLRGGNAEESAKPDNSPFAGKCLVLHTKDKTGGAYLENAEVRKISGRDFVSGKVIAINDRWIPLAGKTMWIALEEVAQIYE